MTPISGSQYLFSAGSRPARLTDGREVMVVAQTEDGRLGVLTDHDRWYVATLRSVSGITAATVLKVHGGKPYAYRDAERLASSDRYLVAAAVTQPQTPPTGLDAATAQIMAARVANLRTTTREQDQGVARKAPFLIAGVVVLALLTPPIWLIVWVPAVLFLAFAWLGARSDT